MGIFGAVVGTLIETVKLPVAVVKDVVTLGGALNEHGSYTGEQLEKIKDEAKEE